MGSILFYVVVRKSICEPFIPEFLFGELSGKTQTIQGSRNRHYAVPFPPDDIAVLSKNTAVMPKILGSNKLVLSGSLKEKLESLVDVKWRSAVIGEPFFFDWSGKDGFELFDDYHERELERCLASGKSQDECEMSETTDPGLAYLDFVEQYHTPEFKSETDYFELIAVSSTYAIKNGSFDDVVAMDFDREPVKFIRATSDWSNWFSVSLLQKHKLLFLKSETYAVAPDVFAIMDESFEREYYDVFEICDNDYPVL